MAGQPSREIDLSEAIIVTVGEPAMVELVQAFQHVQKPQPNEAHGATDAAGGIAVLAHIVDRTRRDRGMLETGKTLSQEEAAWLSRTVIIHIAGGSDAGDLASVMPQDLHEQIVGEAHQIAVNPQYIGPALLGVYATRVLSHELGRNVGIVKTSVDTQPYGFSQDNVVPTISSNQNPPKVVELNGSQRWDRIFEVETLLSRWDSEK